MIKSIVKSGLCLGCGLCEAIVSSEKCNMLLDHKKGFYTPQFKQKLTSNEIKEIKYCCPSIHVVGNKNKTVWGNIKKAEEAWSTDSIIRHKASSGGVLTTLAINLIEKKIVDGILHVGVIDGDYLQNRLNVSKTKEEILNNVGSRYAPALVFDHIKEILDGSLDSYAFIGKPCDIAGIKNFLKLFPVYEGRIKYFLSLFCAGMPSYKGTLELMKLAGHDEPPLSIKYRGDGWPGFFKVDYSNHPPFKISYNESWGRILGPQICLRCKICPDGIGLLSDITVGDSWETSNGYPDFTENEGRSFVIIRTDNGKILYKSAIKDNIIAIKPFDINSLNKIQKYQYERRIYVGYRILAIKLVFRIPINFKGLGIINLMSKGKFLMGIKNFVGTSKRFLKNGEN